MSAAAGRSGDFLARMAAASRARESEARARVPEPVLLAAAAARPPPPRLVASPAGFDLVAEIKHRSPAAGALTGAGASPSRQAAAYAAGGAAALSVLTEPAEFHGALEHLAEVAVATPGLPAMRKDFLVAPYQVVEARAAGAGGVLLIAAMLSPAILADMLAVAADLGLFALVEVFDAADLEVAVPALESAGPAVEDGACRRLLGVNCRDLRTLDVDFARFAALAPRLPATLPRVAESGVDTPERAAEVAALGYGFALVGSALMRAADPAAHARALIDAGRGARACS